MKLLFYNGKGIGGCTQEEGHALADPVTMIGLQTLPLTEEGAVGGILIHQIKLTAFIVEHTVAAADIAAGDAYGVMTVSADG